ncbi:MAG: hypothetical protein ABSG64_03500 [Solirubrobacteraceae bacterium]
MPKKPSKDRVPAPTPFEVPPIQQALARMTGAKLCYSKPIEAAGRTVIAVASVRTAGGFGFGRGGEPVPVGGGGGGAIDARPVGFIEIGPDGARFQPIGDRRLPLAAVAGGAVGALLLLRARRRHRDRISPPRHARRLTPRRRRAELSYPLSQRS